MALIVIADWMFYGAMGISVLFFLAGIGIYILIHNNAPDALEHWKAARQGKPICRVHYKNRRTHDYVAIEKKEETELGANYWEVPTLGLKFKAIAGQTHFIEGSIPCIDYYETTTEPILVEQAVAFSQLRDYFAKLDMPIDSIEEIVFYVSSENQKLNDKNHALNNARITKGETQKHIKEYLAVVDGHKKEIENLKLQSGTFTWLTAMKAIDSAIALSSAHLANFKETIRAAEKLKLEGQQKDWMKYAAFIIIISIAGLILLYGLKEL